MATWVLLGLALLLGCGLPASVQRAQSDRASVPQPVNAAPVVVDGITLFMLRGSRSYPAQERAEQVRRNIVAAASGETISVTDIHTVEAADRTQILAGNTLLLGVLDVDGEFDGIDRKILAKTLAPKIARAIDRYRSDRSRPVLMRNTALALAAAVFMALVLWAIARLSRWAEGLAERRIQKKLQPLEDKAHRLIRAEQVWSVVSSLLRGARWLFLVLLAYSYLNVVLGLYP